MSAFRLLLLVENHFLSDSSPKTAIGLSPKPWDLASQHKKTRPIPIKHSLTTSKKINNKKKMKIRFLAVIFTSGIKDNILLNINIGYNLAYEPVGTESKKPKLS